MSMRLRAALIALAVVLTGGALAPPAQAIVVSICTIKANNPHGSTHVAGTINSQGTINCSATVDEIFIKVFLHKSTGGSWTNGSRDYFNVRSLSATGATSCSQGPAVFRTQVQYTIQFPAGYNPRYHANNLYSPWTGVACGGATRAAGSDNVGTTEELLIMKRADGSLYVDSRKTTV